MSRGRIKAVEMTLLGEDSVPLARGIVSIDVDEGSPEIISWNGGTFLRIRGVNLYRKTRVMHAGDNFQVAR